MTGLKASGLTAAESFVGHHPDSVVGQQVIDAHFPAGAGQPVVVVAHEGQAAAVQAAFKGVPGITGVTRLGNVSVDDDASLQGTLTSAPDSLVFLILGLLLRAIIAPVMLIATAFGVLLDTIVVRSVLVTALNLDLGRWVWWPSNLYREPAPEVEPREQEPTAVP